MSLGHSGSCDCICVLVSTLTKTQREMPCPEVLVALGVGRREYHNPSPNFGQ